MVKGVFTTRINPAYDDLPEAKYHFPRMYLNQVRQTVGDQIVYYEPGRSSDTGARSGRQAYFAVAEVTRIEPDPMRADHYYALIKNYLDFDEAVPFRLGLKTIERNLEKSDGSINRGAFGRAVRLIDDVEFQVILAAGFQNTEFDFVPEQHSVSAEMGFGLAEDEAVFERPDTMVTQNRRFRDRAFARKIKAAYDKRCAITGLRILNGLGRPEVQAAHIQPVEALGPDSVRNGLALSSTFHWLFDRGLISLSDEFEILRARSGIPAELSALVNRSGIASVPANLNERPHPQFLRFHRENIFKG